jgi:hypothetical protein
MSRGEFADFLEASLDALAEEKPRSRRRLDAAMTSRPVRFDVEGDSFVLHFEASGFRMLEPGRPAALDLGLSKQTVLDLVEGRISIDEAIWTDALALRGSVDELASFFDALLVYLRAAVRCPSFPDLFDRYRQGRPDSPHRA